MSSQSGLPLCASIHLHPTVMPQNKTEIKQLAPTVCAKGGSHRIRCRPCPRWGEIGGLSCSSPGSAGKPLPMTLPYPETSILPGKPDPMVFGSPLEAPAKPHLPPGPGEPELGLKELNPLLLFIQW